MKLGWASVICCNRKQSLPVASVRMFSGAVFILCEDRLHRLTVLTVKAKTLSFRKVKVMKTYSSMAIMF